MNWTEQEPGRWTTGSYLISMDIYTGHRKYHVYFKSCGSADWQFDTLAEAQSFAARHARCWRTVGWIKEAAGSFVSDCGHYRAKREQSAWRLTHDGAAIARNRTLSAAKLHAQDDALDRAMAMSEVVVAETADDVKFDEGVTVTDVLLEAIGAVAKGTEASVSVPARTLLLAAAEAVQKTWKPGYGGLFSVDSVTVVHARLGAGKAA